MSGEIVQLDEYRYRLIKLTSNEVLTLFEMPYRQYLSTNYWKEIREIVVCFYNRKCFVCGDKKKLNVHHFHYESLGKETQDDLLCVCQSCHKVLHCNFNDFILGSKLYSMESIIEVKSHAEELIKIFNNKYYMQLLPLKNTQYWNTNSLKMLWGLSEKETKVMLNKFIKLKLINSVEFNKVKRYFLNHFMFYLIEFKFPKLR